MYRWLLALLIAAAPAHAQAVTGTIDPGMSKAQVIAQLGKPATTRTFQGTTYLLYPNQCGKSCGMQDLVVLDGDSVVDAVFRSPNRHYTGASSSPVATKPNARSSRTGTLVVPPSSSDAATSTLAVPPSPPPAAEKVPPPTTRVPADSAKTSTSHPPVDSAKTSTSRPPADSVMTPTSAAPVPYGKPSTTPPPADSAASSMSHPPVDNSASSTSHPPKPPQRLQQ